MSKSKPLIGCIVAFLFIFQLHALAEQTQKLTLKQADSIFLTRNLELLAERYHVDAQQALIQQSKLWNNPTLIINQGLYNGNGGKKWFDTSNNGETTAQISQLITLAGKRNKQISIAQLNTTKAEQSYFDLMRSLKLSLHASFYSIYYLQQMLAVYNSEIGSLNKLISVFEEQYAKGYVSKKELLRLKSSLFTIENEKLNYQSQLTSSMADINIMLSTHQVVYQPVFDSNTISSLSSFSLSTLIDTALVERYDLKVAETDAQISKLNIDYQRALAVPDVSLIAGWDKNGGVYKNYNYVGLQIDLPFINRNQGNIKAAKIEANASQYHLQLSKDRIKNEVVSAYANALNNDSVCNKFDKFFITDINKLSNEMLLNYEKKNIGLVEFLDYYDAFKENSIELNTLQLNRMNARENLWFCIGKELTNNK